MIQFSLLISYIRKIWFFILIGIITLIFLNNPILGIWLAGFFFLFYFISFSLSISSKRRLIRTVRDNLLISDEEIAHKLKRPIDDIRKTLHALSRNQKKKGWLIAYLNNRYIFLNENAVNLFNQLYVKGYNEKQIFEQLQKKMKIRSRAEVKAIELTLENHNRLQRIKERT